MEKESPEQINLEFEAVPISQGDVLLYKQDGNGELVFVNEAGFKTQFPPDGTLIKTGLGGLYGVEEGQGVIRYKDGGVYFNNLKPNHFKDGTLEEINHLMKFWSGDEIIITKLP